MLQVLRVIRTVSAAVMAVSAAGIFACLIALLVVNRRGSEGDGEEAAEL